MSIWLAGGSIVAIAVALLVTVLARRKIGARSLPDALRPGSRLPTFTALSETGEPISTGSLLGAPSVIIFVRGNWCPFCTRQVANLVDHYKRINELGARLILLTPKPLETTRRVAEFFDLEFDFWLDDELKVATQLGLVQQRGVPKSHRTEYGMDTLWPTSLVMDSAGVIRYASISKFIADRPDPEKIVGVLQDLMQ